MNGKIARELRNLARLLTTKHWTDYVFIKREISRPSNPRYDPDHVQFGSCKTLAEDCMRARYKWLKQEYKEPTCLL